MKTHLDLFSGIGGFSIAATMAGFKTVAFCEIEPYAQQILKEKFGSVMENAESQRSGTRWQNHGQPFGTGGTCGTGKPILHPDIFKLNGRDYAGVDLITGGFPCQPFSCAGKRRGKEDDRHLWPEMLRVIAEARPAWVLGENVAGIITMELDGVLSDLENLGYAAWPLVIPAVAVDARHRRDRVWILASNTASRTGTKHEREHEWTQVTCSGRSNGLEPREDVADAKFAENHEQHQQCGRYSESRRDSLGRETETARPEKNDAGSNGVDGCCKNVPNSNRTGPQGRDIGKLQERSGEWIARSSNPCCVWPDEAEWFPQSPICRVADGIPNRAHRLRGLGNAIVPQVAYEILKAIPL